MEPIRLPIGKNIFEQRENNILDFPLQAKGFHNKIIFLFLPPTPKTL